jgi:hypothetical protein
MGMASSLGQTIKRALYAWPAMTNAIYRARYSRGDGSLATRFDGPGKSNHGVFDAYFEHNNWGDAESLSGPGSNLAGTAMVRRALPALLRKYGVRTLLDAPCGDLYWMREVVDASEVQYIG